MILSRIVAFFSTFGSEFFLLLVLPYVIPAITLDRDEELILESGASHYKGAEAVGGKLILTNKRLIFRSHNFNVQNHQEEFSVSEIKSVANDESKYKIFKLELANSKIHKFLVDDPSDWIKSLSH